MPKHQDNVDPVVVNNGSRHNPPTTNKPVVSIEVSADSPTSVARYRYDEKFGLDWKTLFRIEDDATGSSIEFCTEVQVHLGGKLGEPGPAEFTEDSALTLATQINKDDWYMWSRSGRLLMTLQLGSTSRDGPVDMEVVDANPTVFKLRVGGSELARVTVKFDASRVPDTFRMARVQRSAKLEPVTETTEEEA